MSALQQLLLTDGCHPKVIGNPYVFYSADREVRGGSAHGASIGTLHDLGPLGINATASDTDRPTLVTGDAQAGNHAVLSFDGTSDDMALDAIIAALDLAGSDKPWWSAAILAYDNSIAGAPCYFSLGNTASDNASHALRVHSTGVVSQRRNDDAASGPKTIQSSTAVVVGQMHVRVDTFDGLAGRSWLDGTEVTYPSSDLDVGTCTFNRASIGVRRGAGNSNQWQGRLAALALGSGAISEYYARGLSRWLQLNWHLITV